MKTKLLRLLLLLLPAVCILSMAALAEEDGVWRSGNGETYATITDAIRHNPLYGTITLLENAEGAAITVPANDRLTIDLGGHTYTATATQAGSPAVLVNAGSVATLKNGELVGSGALPYLIVSSGRLTVDGMVLTAEEDVQTAMILAQNGSVTIRGNARIVTGSCIVQSEPAVPVSIQDGLFSGSFMALNLSITGGQFYNCEELPIAPGYELDEESRCVVPVGGACAEHVFGAWASVDENTHRRACTQCTFSETAPHSYGAPVFDWGVDGDGIVTASCRLRCRDCGHIFPVSDVAVTVKSETEGGKLYEAAYSFLSGSAVKTFRSCLEVADSYSVTLNGEGGSYPYGAVATLEIPGAAMYYDFYEDGVLIAERATAIEVTVTRDRHFTAEPHTDGEAAAEAPLVRVGTPLKRGNKWEVTLVWAIPDGISDTGESDAEVPTLVEAGLYYLYATEAPGAETLVQSGKQVVAPVEEGGALNGSFTLTAEVSEGNDKTMYALGYVICQIGETRHTAYADTVAVGTAADMN